MFEQLTRFYIAAPNLCSSRGWVLKDLLFTEFTQLVTEWISSERQKLAEFDKLAGLAAV